MRLDLFLSGAFSYRVGARDAQTLFLLLQREKISPKALKRVKKTGDICFCLSSRDSARFVSAAKADGVDFLSQGRGLRTLSERFFHSPGLVIGVLLALLVLVGARLVLWDVRVTGNEHVDGEEIKEHLSQNGLSVGTLLPRIDTDDVALSLRRADGRITYAAVNLVGTVAYVQIREAQSVPEETVKRPANLVAKCDGVVTMPLVFEGECLVSPGEIVRAGQILASGISDTQNHGYLVTRAAGQVFARTKRTYEVNVPFSYEEKEYTGREWHEICVFFFGRAQKVFKNTGKSVESCDIIEKTEYLTLSTGERLPIGYGVKTSAEYRTVSRTRTGAEARVIAIAELQKLLAADSAAYTLLEKHLEYRVDEAGITLICTVVCEEDIARVAEFELHS